MINTQAICVMNEYPREKQPNLFWQSSSDIHNPTLEFGSTADAYKCFIIFDVIDYEGISLESRAIRMQDFVNRVIENTLSPILVDKMPYQVYSRDTNVLGNGRYSVDFKLKIHLKYLPYIESLPSNVTELTPIKESQDFHIRIGGYSIINDEFAKCTDIELSVHSLFNDPEVFHNFAERMDFIRNVIDTMERETGVGNKVTKRFIKAERSNDSLTY